MFDAKKYFYLIFMFSFLTASLSFHLWAEEGSKETTPDREKVEEQQEKVPAQDQPRITFDSTKYDAGEVWEGDIVSHAFIVKNTGTAQLNILTVRPG